MNLNLVAISLRYLETPHHFPDRGTSCQALDVDHALLLMITFFTPGFLVILLLASLLGPTSSFSKQDLNDPTPTVFLLLRHSARFALPAFRVPTCSLPTVLA